MRLNQHRIALLRPHLEGRRVDLDAFVGAWQRCDGAGESRPPAERLALARDLVETFARIDTLGAGAVAWEDITSFAASCAGDRTATAASDASITPVAGVSSVVYRATESLGVPDDPPLPTAPVTRATWVPELQQLFVTYAGSSTVYVLNQLCRLVARLHANLPPDNAMGVQSTAGGGRLSVGGPVPPSATAAAAPVSAAPTPAQDGGAQAAAGRARRRASVAAANAVVPVPIVTWTSAVTPLPRARATSAAPRPRRVPGAAAARAPVNADAADSTATAGSLTEAMDQRRQGRVEWARGVLRATRTAGGPRPPPQVLLPGQRQLAARELSTLGRRASWVAALPETTVPAGADGAAPAANGSDSDNGDDERASGVDAAAPASHSITGAPASGVHAPTGVPAAAAPAAADAAAASAAATSALLQGRVHRVVGERTQRALARAAMERERAAARAFLRAHPAGLPVAVAERMRHVSVGELAASSPSVLASLGMRTTGTSLWRRLQDKLSTARPAAGAAADGGAVAPAAHGPAGTGSGGRAVAAARPGQLTVATMAPAAATAAAAATAVTFTPLPNASGLAVAYDGGSNGRIRDFGFELAAMPRFQHWSKSVQWQRERRRLEDARDVEGAAGAAAAGTLPPPPVTAAGPRPRAGGGSLTASTRSMRTLPFPGGRATVTSATDDGSRSGDGGGDADTSTDDGGSDGGGTPVAAAAPRTREEPAPPTAAEDAAALGGPTPSAAASRKPAGMVRPPSRLQQLAEPAGAPAEGAQLAVAYCMPVDARAAADARTWRALAPGDVTHLLAVSSADLFISLWRTRTFEYAGVLHVLQPQDVLAWSTGANLLFAASSAGGHVTGWDVLSGAKVVQLVSAPATAGAVGNPATAALLDMGGLGAVVTGGSDGRIRVWGYRADAHVAPEGEGLGVAGLRGRRPPRPPSLTDVLVGHTAPVVGLATLETGNRLVSIALGTELCAWDAGAGVLLYRVTQAAVGGAALTAVAITATKPAYVLTADTANTLRLWALDGPPGPAAAGTTAAIVRECLDLYHVPGLPRDGLTSLVVPTPHPHVIVGGRKLVMLAPAAPQRNGDLLDVGTQAGAGLAGVPVALAYSVETARVVVAEGDGVIVFDARTGARLHRAALFKQLAVSLAVEGGAGGRHALVGDSEGAVAMVSLEDGSTLACADPPHADDVTRIVTFPEDGVFLSAGWDRSLRAYGYGAHAVGGSRGRPAAMPLLRLVENAAAADISAMDASRPLALVATGATDGTLRLWDACTFAHVGSLQGHTAGLSAVAFAGPAAVPLLVSADDAGVVLLWAVRGSAYAAGRLLLGLRNFGYAAGPPPPSLRMRKLQPAALQRKRTPAAVTAASAALATQPSAAVTVAPAAPVPGRPPRVASVDSTHAARSYVGTTTSVGVPVGDAAHGAGGAAVRAPAADPELAALVARRATRRSVADKLLVLTGDALENARRTEATGAANAAPASHDEEDLGDEDGLRSDAGSLPDDDGSDGGGVPAGTRRGSGGSGGVGGGTRPVRRRSSTASSVEVGGGAGESRSGVAPPATTAPPASAGAPRRPSASRTRSTAAESSRRASDPGPDATVPVPVTALVVSCDAVDTWPAGAPVDERTPLTFLIAVGDAQGQVKLWDVSHVVARFAAPAARLGVGLLPAHRHAPAAAGYQPRQTKHRVFPLAGDTNSDAQVAAAAAVERLLRRRRVHATASVTDVDAAFADLLAGESETRDDMARTSKLLTELRGRRRGPGARVAAATAAPRAATPSADAPGSATPLVQPEGSGGATPRARTPSASAFRIFSAASGDRGCAVAPPLAATGASCSTPRRGPSPNGWAAGAHGSVRRLSAQTSSAATAEVERSAPTVATAGTAHDDDDTPHALARRQSSLWLSEVDDAVLRPGVGGMREAEEADDVQPGRPVVYPPTQPLLGAIVRGRLILRHRALPLLPVLARPTGERVTGGAAASIPGATPTGHGLSYRVPVPPATPTRVAASSPLNALLTTAEADELWYTFDCTGPAFAARRAAIEAAADAEARRLHWPQLAEPADGAGGRPSIASAAASTDSGGAPRGCSSGEARHAASATRRASSQSVAPAPPSLAAPTGIRHPPPLAAAAAAAGGGGGGGTGGGASASSGASTAGGSRGATRRPAWAISAAAWTASRMRHDIRPVASWTAHVDAVTALTLVHDPPTLVSASTDRSVRMWTLAGLPVGVVTAIPRNAEMEEAMAAARAALAAMGSVDSEADHRAPPNLPKEGTPWQFVPDDTQRIARQTRTAQAVLERIAVAEAAAAHRAASGDIAATAAALAAAGASGSDGPATARRRRHVASALQQSALGGGGGAAALARRGSSSGAAGSRPGSTRADAVSLALSQEATAYAEAAVVTARRPATAGARTNRADGSATGCFALQRTGAGGGTTEPDATAAGAGATRGHGDGSRDDDDDDGDDAAPLPEDATRALDAALIHAIGGDERVLPGGEQARRSSGGVPPQVPEVVAVHEAARRASTVAGLPPAIADEIARRAIASVDRAEAAALAAVWSSDDGAAPGARHRPQPSRLREVDISERYDHLRTELSSRGSARAAAADRAVRAALDVAATVRTPTAADLAGRGVDASATTRIAAAAAAAAATVGRPTMSGTDAGSARGSTPRTAAPAAGAAPPASTRVGSAASAAASRAVRAVTATHRSAPTQALPQSPPPQLPPIPSLSRRFTSDEGAGDTVSETDSGSPPGSPSDAAAPATSRDSRRPSGAPPPSSSGVGAAAPRPSTAAPRLSTRAQASAQRLYLRATALDAAGTGAAAPLGSDAALATADDVDGGGDGINNGDNDALHRRLSASLGAVDAAAAAAVVRRAPTAHAARRPATSGGFRTIVPPRLMTTTSLPTTAQAPVHNATAPHDAAYAPPRQFGPYTLGQVAAFRRMWRRLDRDGSGTVDVVEALNSRFFAAASLKTTKAVFGAMDADSSGEIDLREMLRVTFPLADAVMRGDMARYLRHLDRVDAAAAATRAADDAAAEERARRATSGGAAAHLE